jgi:hypothetical protein
MRTNNNHISHTHTHTHTQFEILKVLSDWYSPSVAVELFKQHPKPLHEHTDRVPPEVVLIADLLARLLVLVCVRESDYTHMHTAIKSNG